MAQRRRSRSSGKKGKKGSGWFRGNIHVVMVMKLLLMLVLLFLSRILFYLFNLGYFSSLSFTEAIRIFFIGLRFDLSALLIINVPFILMNTLPFKFRYNRVYQIIANVFYYALNIIALMGNFVDSIYFRFTLKRTTADIFQYLGVGGDFDKLIPQFLLDFWFVAIIWIFFVILLVWIAAHFKVAPPLRTKKGFDPRFYGVNTVLFLILAGLSVIGIRGGLQLRPITLVTAGQYTTAKNVPLLLNTPFALVKTFRNEALKEVNWFRKEKELDAIYSPVHHGRKNGFRHMNVMIIIMESFSREHIGSLNRSLDDGRYQGFTPFMDSLIRHGLYFNAFANGKTSIQGIPAILSGIPSLMNESFIQSNYAADKFTSIAGLLKPKGYTTAFFHGGTNGTMGFNSYTKMAGFDHYYGRSEYNNEKDYDGKWGIRDEEFFQFTARTMNGFKQPFVATLFSLSSHHPYFVPGKFANVLRKGKLPIQQSIMYSDYSLGEFFHTIKHMPWYKNTLFVITADHTSEGYYPYYQTDVGQYAIPLLFFQPGSDLKGKSPVLAQQTDIMPTVLNYLGYEKSYIAFGNNLFDSTLAHFSIHYISGLYGLIKDDHFLEFDGTKATSLYDLKADPMQRTNLVNKKKEEREKLEFFIKAVIQQSNNRIIENRLTIED
ncbi:MAG: LTA synthase family protein [Bacteroidales bacterium]|nr:LTA synthase family protein [Bacteroidales bacterium]